ncbi:hypothetical protein SteCoe_34926 [Stentor coeruleus]|uniref:Uncharacterized protein n=1 Tax=Stentor coeruleus TaxID=5963 RepID=A0A1R2ATG0_9CILI|nr:hypothetical protein SteCoe_34926 [Stentor coeruleus]
MENPELKSLKCIDESRKSFNSQKPKLKKIRSHSTKHSITVDPNNEIFDQEIIRNEIKERERSQIMREIEINKIYEDSFEDPEIIVKVTIETGETVETNKTEEKISENKKAWKFCCKKVCVLF